MNSSASKPYFLLYALIAALVIIAANGSPTASKRSANSVKGKSPAKAPSSRAGSVRGSKAGGPSTTKTASPPSRAGSTRGGAHKKSPTATRTKTKSLVSAQIMTPINAARDVTLTAIKGGANKFSVSASESLATILAKSKAIILKCDFRQISKNNAIVQFASAKASAIYAWLNKTKINAARMQAELSTKCEELNGELQRKIVEAEANAKAANALRKNLADIEAEFAVRQQKFKRESDALEAKKAELERQLADETLKQKAAEDGKTVVNAQAEASIKASEQHKSEMEKAVADQIHDVDLLLAELRQTEEELEMERQKFAAFQIQKMNETRQTSVRKSRQFF